MTIVDPSVCLPEDGSLTHPYKYSVNCFTNTYEQWLPRPEVNDVVILRDVKVMYIVIPPVRMTDFSVADRIQWQSICYRIS